MKGDNIHQTMNIQFFSELKKAVTIEHSEKLMTIAERLEQRGKEAGIQIGEQRGKEAGIQIGEQRGKEAGIQIGEQKGIKNVASNMIAEGIDTKLIAKFTGMSEEEISKLKNN